MAGWWEVVNEFLSFAFLVDKASLHLLNCLYFQPMSSLVLPFHSPILLQRVNKQLGEGLSCQQVSAHHNSIINFNQWSFNAHIHKSDDLMKCGNYQLCHEPGRTYLVFPDYTKLYHHWWAEIICNENYSICKKVWRRHCHFHIFKYIACWILFCFSLVLTNFSQDCTTLK